MVQASIRRLKRSPSLWTTSDRSLPINEARDRHIHNLRAEPQLSDQEKCAALRRARKIVQVFGSEAPTNLLQGGIHCNSHATDHRDSLTTIVSADLHPSIDSVRHRSESDSSVSLLESNQPSSPSLDQLRPSSDVVSIDTSESSCPASTFSERRRRAAKLTQFFGVNYQDISQSIVEKLLLPLPNTRSSDTNDMTNTPVLEVDIKVAGRRFWGLRDGEMKSADVADVIGKLRGLRAA
ncbi:hypothetical protein H0H87_011040 [Tephrocybe sp. NHM501043]|nr:hypothetical protein H0H87_011040 [Tephrocybe sp. NHM501043]